MASVASKPRLDAKRLPHIGDRDRRRAVIFRIVEADLHFELLAAGTEARLGKQSFRFVLPLKEVRVLPGDGGGRAITFNSGRHETIAGVHGAAPDALGEELAVDRHG